MNPRSRRYSTKVVARAREHAAAGWTAYRIPALIESEFGLRPHITTVRTWTDPEYAVHHREKNRAKERRRYQLNQVRPRRFTDEWKLDRMRELYLRGVSLRAIGQVAAVWWGEELTETQVYKALGIKRGELGRKGSARLAR